MGNVENTSKPVEKTLNEESKEESKGVPIAEDRGEIDSELDPQEMKI